MTPDPSVWQSLDAYCERLCRLVADRAKPIHDRQGDHVVGQVERRSACGDDPSGAQALRTTWAVIVALSRFGGLRCPSETLSLKWGDIDWEIGRMSVPEPKVEHHEGRGIRSVPLFLELRAILERAFQETTVEGKYPSAENYVVDKPGYRAEAMRPGGWANANLRTQFLKILRRAGVAPWDRLFHSMRATRQTELERELPRYVVCAWMGNTAAVAEKNYLLVTEQDFAKACSIGVDNCPEKAAQNPAQLDAKTAQNPAQQGFARSTHGNEETPENTGENAAFPMFSGVSGMEADGLEPTTLCLQSRCSPN